MIFYHGCHKAAWDIAVRRGYLLHDRGEATPCTYLAVEEKEARMYGDTVLRVEYEPCKGDDNYNEGCWQMRVYVPIPLSNVTKLGVDDGRLST